MAREYKLLNKYEEYDKDAVEELAEAMNEVAELEARTASLKDLIHDNENLFPFVWKTAEGKTIALHNIDDDHLKNIMTYCLSNGREISKSIKAEARRRGFEIPTFQDFAARRLLAARDAEIIDPESIPF